MVADDIARALKEAILDARREGENWGEMKAHLQNINEAIRDLKGSSRSQWQQINTANEEIAALKALIKNGRWKTMGLGSVGGGGVVAVIMLLMKAFGII